ncbi:MAG: hypothetical protein EOO44_06020, partial [Flavobacterium sp.]
MYSVDKIKLGTRFIDLKKDYNEIKLITAYFDNANKNKFSLFWYNFPDDPTIIEMETFQGIPFPDLLSPQTEIYGRFEELR